jgi:hypothetical protein
MQQYNCVGCHEIEKRGGFIRRYYQENPTLAPPVLNGQGEKVQSNWFFSFLKAPIPIRPWLEIRMPTFGMSDEHANQIVGYFNGLSKVDIPYAQARGAGGRLGAGFEPGAPALKPDLDHQVAARSAKSPTGNQDAVVFSRRTRQYSWRQGRPSDRGLARLSLEHRAQRSGCRASRGCQGETRKAVNLVALYGVKVMASYF